MRNRFPLLFLMLALLGLPRAGHGDEVRVESLLEKILRIAGISATPSQLRGPGDEVELGDIWVARLGPGTHQRLTWDGDYRSPVFEPGDEAILAVEGNNIARIPVSGGEAEKEKLYTIKGLVKLVGFSMDDQDKVLILTEDENGRLTVGLLSVKSGQVTTIPYDRSSKDDRRMITHMKGWERVYRDTTVYVKPRVKQGMAGATEWTDVYIKRGGGAAVNVSGCDGVNCGQPSLSHDGRQVVFIRGTMS